jgi:hypothetical protein
MLDKKWSEMSTQELLDEAKAEADGTERGDARAALLLKAAQIQSQENLTWTLEQRVLPALTDALWRIGKGQ